MKACKEQRLLSGWDTSEAPDIAAAQALPTAQVSSSLEKMS